MFQIFDKDANGSILLQEFIEALHHLAGQSPDDKIKFLFKVCDIDGKDSTVLAMIAVQIYDTLVVNRAKMTGFQQVAAF